MIDWNNETLNTADETDELGRRRGSRGRRVRPGPGQRGRPRATGQRTRPGRRHPPGRPQGRPSGRVWGRPPVKHHSHGCSCARCRTAAREYARWVQTRLNDRLNLRLPVDGVSGPATRSAIRDFQRREGLPVDGIVGPATERALAAGGSGAADAAPTADSAGAAGGNGAEPAAADGGAEGEFDIEELEAPIPRPTLRYGSRGSAVVELQRRLSALGFSPGVVDGIFGLLTKAAVKAFQHARRIVVDGIVGQQTWGQLYGRSPTPSLSTRPHWTPPSSVISAGDAQTVRYDSPLPWANGTNCSGNFTDGAAELRRYILANFDGVSSIGGYNCRVNSAKPSETSVHGVGRALDIMIPTVGGNANSTVGDPIANWLIRNAEAIGVQYIIWNRMRWSGSRTPRLASYGGPNPHVDHIHVELNRDGARRATAWFGRDRRRTVD